MESGPVIIQNKADKDFDLKGFAETLQKEVVTGDFVSFCDHIRKLPSTLSSSATLGRIFPSTKESTLPFGYGSFAQYGLDRAPKGVRLERVNPLASADYRPPMEIMEFLFLHADEIAHIMTTKALKESISPNMIRQLLCVCAARRGIPNHMISMCRTYRVPLILFREEEYYLSIGEVGDSVEHFYLPSRYPPCMARDVEIKSFRGKYYTPISCLVGGGDPYVRDLRDFLVRLRNLVDSGDLVLIKVLASWIYDLSCEIRSIPAGSLIASIYQTAGTVALKDDGDDDEPPLSRARTD